MMLTEILSNVFCVVVDLPNEANGKLVDIHFIKERNSTDSVNHLKPEVVKSMKNLFSYHHDCRHSNKLRLDV